MPLGRVETTITFFLSLYTRKKNRAQPCACVALAANRSSLLIILIGDLSDTRTTSLRLQLYQLNPTATTINKSGGYDGTRDEESRLKT